MNKPIRTKTPAGEDIIIVSAADYDKLVELAEDAADVRLAERSLADLYSGKTEALTSEEMLEYLDAASPLGFWRKRRGLTQAALASKVGSSQAYLAQIESGKRTGDIGIYRRLSEALSVDMEELVPIGPDESSRSRRAKPKRKK